VAAVLAAVSAASGRADEAVGGPDETEKLRKQVRVLAAALGDAMARVDAIEARLDRKAFDNARETWGVPSMGSAGLGETEYRVVEVNKELGIAVLNGGRRQGLRPGLEFAVTDGDKVVATLRTVDVRGAIAGAVIERRGRSYPRAQDRAVLASGSRE
jgi:hypothetical protein